MLELRNVSKRLFAESASGGWQEGSVPLLVSSIWMMGFAVMAARLAFLLPRDAFLRLWAGGPAIGHLAGLGLLGLTMRANTERPEPQCEEEPAERILTLDVWDSRFSGT